MNELSFLLIQSFCVSHVAELFKSSIPIFTSVTAKRAQNAEFAWLALTEFSGVLLAKEC